MAAHSEVLEVLLRCSEPGGLPETGKKECDQ